MMKTGNFLVGVLFRVNLKVGFVGASLVWVDVDWLAWMEVRTVAWRDGWWGVKLAA